MKILKKYHMTILMVLAFCAGLNLNGIKMLDRHHRDGDRKEWIPIHYTACPCKWGDATSVAGFLLRKRNAGAHYVVDDSLIIQTALEEWSVPAVGGRNWKGFVAKNDLDKKVTNANSVNYEMCLGWERDNERIIDVTAAAAAYQMVNKGLDIGSVVRHHDVRGKYCPFFGSVLLTEEQWLKYYRDPIGSGFWNQTYEDRQFYRFKLLVQYYHKQQLIRKDQKKGKITPELADKLIKSLVRPFAVFYEGTTPPVIATPVR